MKEDSTISGKKKGIRLPNFLVIGAGKSGTTSLDHYLHQHPDIFMSRVKEPNFFALMGEKPVEAKDDPEQMYHYPQAVYAWEDYRALFQEVENEKAIGETSPMYLYNAHAPHRIRQLLGEKTKLIAILRHPVDRLYSRYLHLARENRLPSPRFEDALDRDSIWWRRPDLVTEGFYFSYLKNYFDIFPREQIRVYRYEDFKKDPQGLMRDLFTFLGVNPEAEIDTELRLNASGFVKNRWKDRLIGQQSILRGALEKLAPALLDQMRQSTYWQKKLNNLRAQNLARPQLDAELRLRILEEIYAKDVWQTAQLIDQDLNAWFREQPA